MGNLFVVATPIGNLEDISARALRVLREVDVILCEDTRVTKKLLAHYRIATPVLSYHQHSLLKKEEQIADLLAQGKNLALVSDAGAPGISDPGNKLIEFLEKNKKSVKVIPVPGCSALIAAASVSGLPMDKFIFLGFPPHKNKRKKFFTELFEQLKNFQYPVIIYESPHRILKTLAELENGAQERGMNPDLVVGRELTKKFETINRGKISAVISMVKSDKIKGEFVIIIH